jgi:hypothetical protein
MKPYLIATPGLLAKKILLRLTPLGIPLFIAQIVYFRVRIITIFCFFLRLLKVKSLQLVFNVTRQLQKKSLTKTSSLQP